jgi:hypothetical protein
MQAKNNRAANLIDDIMGAVSFVAVLLCVAVLAVGSIFQAYGADANYSRIRKRVVGRELIDNGAQVVYTYEQAGRTWSETNAVRHLTLPREIRYSKLKLILAAKSAGKWADVKAFIKSADMEDEWNACQFIASTHPAYIAATNMVISSGIATAAEVCAFMKAAED